jgi:hypothetical protein
MAVVHVSVGTLMKFLGAHVVGGTTIAGTPLPFLFGFFAV